MQYKGIYAFRFNAETLIRPYDKTLSRVPEFTGASMNIGVHVALPKRTVAQIGGMHHPSSTVCQSVLAFS